jgi:hypothetical protein
MARLGHVIFFSLMLLASCDMTKQEYQVHLIKSTAHLRPKPHSYAGYSGPWLENFFFNYFVSNPVLNQRLRRVYVPICFTDALLQNKKEAVNQALADLDRRFHYFVVVQIDRGIGVRHPAYPVRMPHDINVVGFMSGGCSICNHFQHVWPVPLLKAELHPSIPAPGKLYNVMYQGRSTHGIRKAISEEYADFVSIIAPMSDGSWKQRIEESNFTLCPRGFGETSFRLYESLQLGSIPVYVWQGQRWLAFEDILDWSEFSVVLSSRQVLKGGLKRKIASIQTHVQQMQRSLHNIQYMFSYNYTTKYIIDTLIVYQNANR